MGDTNTLCLEEISGEWAVIHRGKIVAHSQDLYFILEEAERYSDSIVTKILSGQACFY